MLTLQLQTQSEVVSFILHKQALIDIDSCAIPCISGHELPTCLVCEQTGQECSYPARPKKPGPKIGEASSRSLSRLCRTENLQGSFQRQKRQRGRDRQQQQRSRQQEPQTSYSPPASQTSLDQDDADCDRRPSNEYRKESNSAMDVDGSEWSTNQGNTKLNIHDLSFILHPSHEASTPEKEASTAASKDTPEHERQSMVRQACCTLGVSQTMIEQMYVSAACPVYPPIPCEAQDIGVLISFFAIGFVSTSRIWLR